MRPRASATLLCAALLAVFFLSVYLLIGSSDLFHNGDTDLRYQTTQAIVDHHRLWIANPMWKDTREARGIGGHLYAFYAPGQAVLMIPLYVAGKALAHHLSLPYDITTLYTSRSLDLFLGAALAVLYFLMALSIGYSVRTSTLLTLVFGLATPALPDAQSALEQTQVDLLLLAAVWATWVFTRDGMRRRRWLVLAGCASGLGFFTRYDFAIYVPILVLFPAILRARGFRAQTGNGEAITRKDRSSVSVLLRGVPGRTGTVPQSPPSVPINWRTHAIRREKGAEMQAVGADLLAYAAGLLPFMALVAGWDQARFGNPFKTGLHERTLGEPFLNGLLGLLVSPGKGLVWYLPLVFLLPWCLPAFRRRSGPLLVFTGGLVLVPLLFYSNVLYWHGDPAWGPRYLYTTIPYLVLPIGELFERWREARLLKVCGLALVLASLTLQVAAVSVTQWRFWYRLEALEERTSQPFRWGASYYHYYWNPSQSPIVMQLDDVCQVARLNLLGNQQYRFTARPTTCVMGKRCVSNPADLYPINTLAFWWADTRHPLLGPRTREGIASALALSGLGSLVALILVIRQSPSDPRLNSRARSVAARTPSIRAPRTARSSNTFTPSTVTPPGVHISSSSCDGSLSVAMTLRAAAITCSMAREWDA